MSRRWEADFDEWPVAGVRLQGAGSSAAPFESFTDAVDAILRREERCAIVLDLTGASPDANRRRLTAAALDARHEPLERWVVAGALVVPSPVHRGILTAVQWLNPRPLRVAWETFGTPADARAWARTQLRDAARDAERPG
ncbi:MAG: hypothetical protein H6719_30165 [Sandaracinaceae bacterium]|nr:hypothetical protein [Sandaracinaceae bacterium]